tara:strand:- start:278 stop:409 length:132 start_codon:yes stop_codon:yes gene_type:complete
METTKIEAQQWLDENKDVSYLSHGMADRHEIIVRMMQSIVRSE